MSQLTIRALWSHALVEFELNLDQIPKEIITDEYWPILRDTIWRGTIGLAAKLHVDRLADGRTRLTLVFGRENNPIFFHPGDNWLWGTATLEVDAGATTCTAAWRSAFRTKSDRGPALCSIVLQKDASRTLDQEAYDELIESVARKRADICRMASTALHTIKTSNGQQVCVTRKTKEFGFISRDDFEAYIGRLIDQQRGLCALTGLPMQASGGSSDPEMLYSLDRIDSNGHYAPGNLQVVCRFANRWKSDSSNSEFRRLLQLVRTTC